MKVGKLHSIYFSATGTTKVTLNHIIEGANIDVVDEYDIIHGQHESVYFNADDLALFGVPVHSGRVPAIAVDSLNQLKGNSTPAVVICVYGNREYDDALLELRNIVTANGFEVVSAGAFIAEHSIFPAVAAGRPDEQDKRKAIELGQMSMELLATCNEPAALPGVSVKGNFPYRAISNIPIKPKGNSKCIKCGICVKACPVQAISIAHPRKTDKARCISCARCIKVCPEGSRHFGGLIYKLARKKFQSAYGKVRKEPDVFFARKEK